MEYKKYKHEGALLVKDADLKEKDKWIELITESERTEPEKCCDIAKDNGFDVRSSLDVLYDIYRGSKKKKDNKIKVLISCSALPICGAARMQVNIAKYAPEEFEFHYLLYKGARNDYAEELDKFGAVVHVIPEREDGRLQFYRNIAEIVKKNGISVVHTAAKFTAGFILAAAFIAGADIRIAHPHETGSIGDGTIKMKIKNFVMRTTVRLFANRYCGCCRAAGEWQYGEKAFRQKGVVINNGISTEAYKYSEEKRMKIREELGIDKEAFVIGHVAYLARLKNQEFIIKLMPEVLKRKPDSYLILCGADHEHIKGRLIQLVSDLDLENRVIFTGLINNVNEYLSAMDVFVLPSLREAAPIALIEAQANGLPCVVSNTVPNEVDMMQR